MNGEARRTPAEIAAEGKPHAALLRENDLLRKVVAAAIRLRRIGMLADSADEALEELWRLNPEMTRSATQQVMYHQVFQTAMTHFDSAVLEAADAGMDWAANHGLAKPVRPHQGGKP